jgi:hypothetical protein
MAANESR